MKYSVVLAGLTALALCPRAHAQNMLAGYSQAATITATARSCDYRYTKHTTALSGRGGRTATHYSWDPYLDQTVTQSLPLTLGGAASQVSAAGTFYAPTYTATASGQTVLVNTPGQAVLTVNYAGATMVTTTLADHQSVSVTAQPGGTFTFTLAQTADVSVSTFGDPGGVFRLFGSGVGVLVGPLTGANTGVVSDTPLAPGTYWVTSSLTDTAGVDNQLGTSLNPGTASTAWGFTLTLTPGEPDTGGN